MAGEWDVAGERAIRVLNDLEQTRRAHATTNTHGDDDVTGPPSTPLDEGVSSQAGARHPAW